MVELGSSQQNDVLMQLLLAVFGCFATSLVGLFMVILLPLSLLRFEPNFLFAIFGYEL
jgi:hypothetical protein